MSSSRQPAAVAREYATEADFCRLFSEQMNRFYFLALMLTADAKKAEDCFVMSFESCLKSRRIFKDWAQRWATHTIIKTAIQIASPVKGSEDGRTLQLPREVTTAPEAILEALRAIPALDRFVYHMTIIERYLDLECATFLGCSPKDVKTSRERALERLGANDTLSKMVTEFDHQAARDFIQTMVAKAS